MNKTLMPLSQISQSLRRQINAIFTDIDDSITTNGKIPACAFNALWKAYSAGLKVVLVTGRPAGWCDHFARMWPISAVVGENGALCYSNDKGKIRRIYAPRIDDAKIKLDAIKNEVLATIPRARVATDQAYREYDLAIDFAEEVSPILDDKEIDQIVEIYKKHGATVKVSSIHVNGWFGDFDKLTMCKRASDELFDEELTPSNAIYVGDSPNDEPMFKYFEHSCGVANVKDMAHRMNFLPTYIATNRGGEGFSEIIDIVLDR